MPSESLLQDLPFESACYSITGNGVRKLQQQKLRVFTTITRAAVTTLVQQVFYNPFCKTIEDLYIIFPLKQGARITNVYCEIDDLAWRMPEDTYAAVHDILRVYNVVSTIQRRQEIVVNTTIEEKIDYPPRTDAYEWTLPKIMAPPYSSSLPLAYNELSLDIEVDLGEPWTVYDIGSPSHGTVTSDDGWIRMVKVKHADHKAYASFRGKDPHLKKDISFMIFRKQFPQRLDQISPSGDQNKSTRHQTMHSHEFSLSPNFPSATERLTPYSPPLTPGSNLTRCSAPSPELPDTDILSNNVSRLLALQQSGDRFNGHRTSFWTLDRALPEILSISSSTLDSHPDLLKSRVWVTILIIAWFEIIAQDHVEVWLQCVQRARNWLAFVRATGAVKFAGWEIEATNIFSSDEDMEV